MKKKQLILVFLILVFVLIRIIPLFIITPSQDVIGQIDPNQIGYIGLLRNSIIQLLFCLSLIIMLGGFIYVFSSLKTLDPGLLKHTNTILFLIGILV